MSVNDSSERDPDYWLPASENTLFSQRWIPLWTLLRVALGAFWLQAGLRKLVSPEWLGPDSPMKQLWIAGRAQDCGLPNALQWLDVYIVLPGGDRGFTMACTGISVVELIVGVALIAGVLSAFFALLGGLLGLSLMTVDPYLAYMPGWAALATLVVIGWRVAGWWGMDRWLLPLLGAPWTSHRYPASG